MVLKFIMGGKHSVLIGMVIVNYSFTQFKNPLIAFESLFTMVSGDDIYGTYTGMAHVSTPAWIFSKIYLFVFIAFFVCIISSVFISLFDESNQDNDHVS